MPLLSINKGVFHSCSKYDAWEAVLHDAKLHLSFIKMILALLRFCRIIIDKFGFVVSNNNLNINKFQYLCLKLGHIIKIKNVL